MHHLLTDLAVDVDLHNKMPDVVIYDTRHSWGFFWSSPPQVIGRLMENDTPS